MRGRLLQPGRGRKDTRVAASPPHPGPLPLWGRGGRIRLIPRPLSPRVPAALLHPTVVVDGDDAKGFAHLAEPDVTPAGANHRALPVGKGFCRILA